MTDPFYIYRSTTQQLAEALNRVVESGDDVVNAEHVGGRDWVVIARRGAES